jgi:hypothetical protein
MTSKEVQAILGPDGFHTKRSIVIDMSAVMFRRWWVADDAVIVIYFEPKNNAPFEDASEKEPPFEEWQVTEKEYRELPPEPFLERLRRLLPWARPRCCHCIT